MKKSFSLNPGPVYDLAMEEAVLGAIMLSQKETSHVLGILKETDFFSDKHRMIYMCILELERKSAPIDMRTVVNRLQANNILEDVGGAFEVAELVSKVSSAKNVEYHCNLIREFSIKRQAVDVAIKIIAASQTHEADAFDVLSEGITSLEKITANLSVSNFATAEQLCKEGIVELANRRDKKQGVGGILSKIRELDSILFGFRPSELTIIAARPGMGKTAVACTLMLNAASQGFPVALFSLEMKSSEINNRFLCNISQLDSNLIRNGSLDDPNFQKCVESYGKMSTYKYIIDDTSALTTMQFRIRARDAVKNKGVKMIIIDYLQLMKANKEDIGKNFNREQEISNISQTLKQVAKELDVPVIALSQLSRDVEKRAGDKRPMLSDLRDSGAIEQDADVVMFLYRPMYYKQKQLEDGTSTENMLEIIVSKNRHGKQGVAHTNFYMNYMTITDVANRHSPTERSHPIPIIDAKDIQDIAVPF